MDEKDLKELRELIEFLKANEVAEFDMEREDLKVRLKFAGATGDTIPSAASVDVAHLARLIANGGGVGAVPVAGPALVPAAAPAEAAPAPAAEADPLAGAHIVKSPIVGTFYEAPSPDAEAFVKVGDTVRNGQVLCIVEAMKLMNEIESDTAGEILKIFPATGQPVEYGQPLYAIRK
ncbi:MAG TPA: acetyl-CoA carboxylase biotin carboxyl carrier protein [Acidobacteriaceae bacterium]|jgi:acetyl-CoA carboxylase biotin carboxyl carrier protein